MEGTGIVQVDFENYYDWEDKLIFLEKGQYIKFLSDTFTVRQILFENENAFKNSNVRVLFKHLVSIGYINFQECQNCQKYLTDSIYSENNSILDISVNQWYWQNPFNANQSEYQVIFDLKEVIDKEFKNAFSTQEIVSVLGQNGRKLHHLVKSKIGVSIKNLLTKKKILEGQKLIAFSGKNIDSIGYDLGYRDPAYFNRLFKQKIGMTPGAFREQVGFEVEDYFEQELFNLLKEFHTTQRQTKFYASKLYMSEKTLSKKVKEKFNISIGRLIRYELIKTAKTHLAEGRTVSDVAFSLGFKEVSHFTAFFKKYTRQTPTEFVFKKYNR
ncbi:MAG: helix-turn-helix domain-containing protein [Aureispira sp.]